MFIYKILGSNFKLIVLILVLSLLFLASLYISLSHPIIYRLIIIFIVLIIKYLIFFNIFFKDVYFFLEIIKAVVIFKIIINSILVIVFTIFQIKELNILLSLFYSLIIYLFFYKINKNFLIKTVSEIDDLNILGDKYQKQSFKKIANFKKFIIYLLKPEE